MTLLATALALAFLPADPPQPHRSPPNVVLLLADDMGFGDPHCFNPGSKAPTPNLDRLADAGRKFTDAHSPASVCTPTRYAILTGRYAWRTRLKLGVLNPWDPPLIEEGRLTLPAMLKAKGYTTAAFGKWHLGWNWALKPGVSKPSEGRDFPAGIDFTKPITNGPNTRGFDYFFGMVGNTVNSPCLLENDRPIFTGASPPLSKAPAIEGVPEEMMELWQERNSLPMLTEKAVWYIDQQAKAPTRKPFFLYFALTSPHSPIIPHGQYRGISKHGDECDFVSQTDGVVGRVVDALKHNGLDRNTLVIFSSDNGSPGFADENAPTASVIKTYGHRPNGPWRGMKGDIHEGGHRVPMIASWPGTIAPGTVCEETVSLVDLFASLAGLVGHPLTDDVAEDSYDIRPALLDTPHSEPVRQTIIHHALIGTFAIREGDWKLVLGRGSGGFTLPQYFPPKPGEPEGELYNLRTDPREAYDLYAQHPEIVARLTKRLDTYKQSGRSAPKR